MSLKRSFSFLLVLIFLASVLTGCFKKDQPMVKKNNEKIELVYYKLFDEEDVMRPSIQEYEAKHPGISITYRKFPDPIEYQNILLNELAEGEGPDIFSVPNWWFLRNSKKISPMPESLMTPQQFDSVFVNVASQDMAFKDSQDGRRKIFGLPLSVDTLALYYNKAFFEDAVPSRGRPASTWEQLKDDVFRLTKSDNSYERFKVAGIAMGRSDNIARSIDILYLLMIQFKTNFYNDNVSQATFANKQLSSLSGSFSSPAAEALDLYTSFALPSHKNYSWNNYLVQDPKSATKEMDTFARGKVAMIFGYSYLYGQIKDQIIELQQKGVSSIDPKDIGISVVPQVNDPAVASEKRYAYANYYGETVARTSKHPQEAWEFLMYLTSKQKLESYNKATNKPTSRRDMIKEQMENPVYSAFAQQIGYAESFPIYDDQRYNDIFSRAIDSILLSTATVDEAMRTAQGAITNLLPPGGLIMLTKQKVTAGTEQKK